MQEIWKDIINFPNYQISNLGNVYSKKNYKIRKSFVSNGYLCIYLFKNGKRYRKKIHRLVAEAFIPNPNNLPIINHIDGNKMNNIVSNLEWCTSKQNTIHAYKTGLMKTKQINQYDLKGNFIKTWDSIISASVELQLNRKSIQHCCMHRNKTSGGYIWRYADK